MVKWGDKELFVLWDGYNPSHVPGGEINEIMLIPIPPEKKNEGDVDSTLQAPAVPRERIELSCLATDFQEYKDMLSDYKKNTVRVLTDFEEEEHNMVIASLGEPDYINEKTILYDVTFIKADGEGD